MGCEQDALLEEAVCLSHLGQVCVHNLLLNKLKHWDAVQSSGVSASLEAGNLISGNRYLPWTSFPSSVKWVWSVKWLLRSRVAPALHGTDWSHLADSAGGWAAHSGALTDGREAGHSWEDPPECLSMSSQGWWSRGSQASTWWPRSPETKAEAALHSRLSLNWQISTSAIT